MVFRPTNNLFLYFYLSVEVKAIDHYLLDTDNIDLYTKTSILKIDSNPNIQTGQSQRWAKSKSIELTLL